MWWRGNSGGYYATDHQFRYKIYRQVSADGFTTWRAMRGIDRHGSLWFDLTGYTPPPPEPRTTDRHTLAEAKTRVEALTSTNLVNCFDRR